MQTQISSEEDLIKALEEIDDGCKALLKRAGILNSPRRAIERLRLDIANAINNLLRN